VRILFAHNLPYLPALNGAAKMGRCLLEGLVGRNHNCRVVALAGTDNEKLQQLASRDPSGSSALKLLGLSPTSQTFIHHGVEVYAFADNPRLHEQLNHHIREFDPTWVIISEDPTYMLLAAANKIDPRRTLFFSQSQATLPFGPEAFTTEPHKMQMLEEVAGLLTNSEYLRTYIRRWGGLESFFAAIPVYGVPPFRHLGSFDNRFVTMINPSTIKGLPVFLELARRFPAVEFAGVPTWATLAADRSALKSLPNVKVLEPSADIDDVFAQTRVLIVPSLWGEAFGLVAVEAMLRGIPVLASNVGGLPEAKLGVDYVLPLRPIEKYEDRRDESWIPVPVIPDQNIEPWETALRTVLSDKAEFDRISSDSRKAATDYVSGLSVIPTERYLEELLQRRSSFTSSERQKDDMSKLLEGLSPEKLQALATLLKKKAP
jgi:glycosyltransferase involved in cell wall biosynthesis